jgi:hypothetical protein
MKELYLSPPPVYLHGVVLICISKYRDNFTFNLPYYYYNVCYVILLNFSEVQASLLT